MLITSRIANWSAGVEPLELHVLAATDAMAFLLERTPHRRRAADDPSAAAAAARELGCLALALEQAAAYIDKLRLSFTEYLGRWRQKRPEVLRWHDERLMQYPASVAITWETTFAQLREPEQRCSRSWPGWHPSRSRSSSSMLSLSHRRSPSLARRSPAWRRSPWRGSRRRVMPSRSTAWSRKSPGAGPRSPIARRRCEPRWTR